LWVKKVLKQSLSSAGRPFLLCESKKRLARSPHNAVFYFGQFL
jgi:hypothetical protein